MPDAPAPGTGEARPTPAPAAAKAPAAPSSAKTTSSAAPKKPVAPGKPGAPRTGAKAAADKRYWKRLEWTWTLIPILLLAVVGIASAGLMYQLDTGPTAFGSQANYHVNVTGQQWLWSFKYTDAYAKPGIALPLNATNGAVLYVPENAVVEVNVTSLDVIHDFNVPALGVRIDAIPGIINHAWFVIPAGTAPWTEFRIQCTEFCGTYHYNMWTWLVVTPYTNNLPPS